MKLKHIALNISNIDEIENFYINILEMKELRRFNLKGEFSQKFFNIIGETPAVFLEKDEIFFELFLNKNMIIQGYNHICISVKNRKKLIEKAKAANYPVIIVERDFSDLVFIKDNSGNVFEITEDN